MTKWRNGRKDQGFCNQLTGWKVDFTQRRGDAEDACRHAGRVVVMPGQEASRLVKHAAQVRTFMQRKGVGLRNFLKG
jgi:hypothetical protein